MNSTVQCVEFIKIHIIDELNLHKFNRSIR